MTDEKWEQLKETLLAKFPEATVFREPYLEHGEERGVSEVLEFEGPTGPMRVVRISKPKVLDKAFHYSHRPGDTARVDYTLSDTEFVHTLVVLKETDGEWEEIDKDSLGF